MSPEKETKENNAQSASADVPAPENSSDGAKAPSSGQNQPSHSEKNGNSSKGEPASDGSGEHETEEDEDDLNLSNDDLPPVDPPSGKMLLFGNLLSPKECEAIVAAAQPRMARSLTMLLLP